MFDELRLLKEDSPLIHLLAHYAQLGVADREAWQDRMMQLDGVASDQLTRMHGQLIACDWIEQNTGATPMIKPGAVSQCYRITNSGQRALKQALLQRDREADEAET